MLLQQLINGLVLGSIYTAIALGLTMIYGILGIINWAHGELYMLGAFATLYLVNILGSGDGAAGSYFLALLLGIVIMAIFGVLLDKLVFSPLRGKSDNTIILGTLGISFFLQNLAIILFSPNPQGIPSVLNQQNLTIFGASVTWSRAIVVIVTVVLILVLNWFISKTKTGKAMRATSQDMNAARLMGIDIKFISVITTIIGAALAGVAGGLAGPIFLVQPTMGILMVTKAFAVVILGGLGNIGGAILGGFILGIAEALTAGYISSALKDIVAFVIMILVLIVKPEGVFSKYSVEKV